MYTNQSNNTFTNLLWFSLWITLCIAFAIFLPGFSEFDTSKYLSISQTMMNQHEYLLAFWQGHPYSDKPPLLFWLFIAGWKLFGFSTWWPQLLVLLSTLLSMIATQRLSLALWPQQKNIARLVPFILIGCFYWVWFAKQIRVDSLLVLATLVAILSIIKTLQGHSWYWLGYTLALGLGGFSKGPVILAFILLPTIFLPAMTAHIQKFSPKWFAMLGLTTLIGMVIPLAWAIPAAIKGGKLFTEEIFYRQITHRQSMHQNSFFFYLVRLPLWLLPWSIYPPLYKNLKSLRLLRPLSADTICLLIIVCGLITFSVFGQKLPHYIYPLFPFFALLIARLCASQKEYKKWYQWPMATLTLSLALFCLAFPLIKAHLPENTYIRGYFLQEVNLTTWGYTLLASTALLLFLNVATTGRQIILISLANFLIVLFVNTTVLYQYQHHLKNVAVLTTLNSTNKAILVYGQFTDPAINQFIHENNVTQLTKSAFQHWGDHPHGILLTSDASLLHQKIKPLAWFYQTRFSIVSVWRK